MTDIIEMDSVPVYDFILVTETLSMSHLNVSIPRCCNTTRYTDQVYSDASA